MCVQSVGESGPLCGQSEHPPVEGLYPQGTVRHTDGQVVQSVASVPCRKALEILPEGMVFPYVRRMHHACYISVPTVDAVAVCFEADGVQVAFRGGPEGSVSPSDRQRNSVASVSTLKRNSYRSARKSRGRIQGWRLLGCYLTDGGCGLR